MQSAVKIFYIFDCLSVTNWKLLPKKMIQFIYLFIASELGSSVIKVFQVTKLYLAMFMCIARVACGWNVSMVDLYWQGTPKSSSETCPCNTLSVSNYIGTELPRWEASGLWPETWNSQAALQFRINVKQALNWTDTEIMNSIEEVLKQTHNVKFCRNSLTSFRYHICVRIILKAYRPDHYLHILLSSMNRCHCLRCVI
jgi:hypothetical protein